MYTLRAARKEDLEPMMNIAHEGLRPHVQKLREWNHVAEEKEFLAHFEIEKISIIQRNGKDVGYIKIDEYDDHAFVDGIYIGSSSRSQSLGAKVLGDVITGSEKPVRLRVHKTNPAQKLYRRLGFRPISKTSDQINMECPGDA